MQMAAKKIELERRVRALRVKGDEVGVHITVHTRCSRLFAESTKSRVHPNPSVGLAGL